MNGIMLAFVCGLFIGVIVGFNWGRVYQADITDPLERDGE